MYYTKNLNQKIYTISMLILIRKAAKYMINLLISMGLTNKEISQLNQYCIKLSWLFYLEQYYLLPDFFIEILKQSIIEIEDIKMKRDMLDFINFPNHTKCEIIYNEIYSSIPKDILYNLLEILSNIKTHNKF